MSYICLTSHILYGKKKIAPTELLSWVHKDIIQLAKILKNKIPL